MGSAGHSISAFGSSALSPALSLLVVFPEPLEPVPLAFLLLQPAIAACVLLGSSVTVGSYNHSLQIS